MYTSRIATALLVLAFGSSMASASPGGHQHQHNYAGHGKHKPHYAKVLIVKPIYRNVRIERPQLHCDHRNINHSSVTVVHQHAPEQIVLGGVLGGIVGHELGDAHNRGITTLAGVVIGSTLAHNISSTHYAVNKRWEQPQPSCREYTHVFERKELAGYKVKYKYRGQVFTTHTLQHPGNHILVEPAPAVQKSFIY